MCEQSNDPCLVSSPVHVSCLQTNGRKLTELKAMGEGTSRMLQEDIENEEKQS